MAIEIETIKTTGDVVTCNEEDCDFDASVKITSEDQGYEQTPFCTGHAHVVVSDWMVGL